MRILFPVDGDMLYPGDGTMQDGNLIAIMRIEAPAGSVIVVNDKIAAESDGVFSAPLTLTAYRNDVRILNRSSSEERSVEVYRIDGFQGSTRLSIDDNIRFLQDLTINADRYTSLFDNPYLGSLKKLHDHYGTAVHLNLFYQTEGFDLSMMTDKFRNEWLSCADWIRLSFHALQEFPDKPYINAGYQQVKWDCDLVMREIRRFAGERLTGPVTTVHWGETTVEGSRALRDAGYKGQLGYFNADDDLPPVSYYLNIEQRRRIKKRFVWKDTSEDIVFVRTSIVIDTKKHDEIIPFLEQYKTTTGKPPYLDLLVHEQYYYPDYKNYQPDYFEKLETAVHWAQDNQYRPAFLENCIFDK